MHSDQQELLLSIVMCQMAAWFGNEFLSKTTLRATVEGK